MPDSKSPDSANTKTGGKSIILMPKSTAVKVKPESSISYAAEINPPISDADILSKRLSENHLRYVLSSELLSVPETMILKKTTITDIIE